MRKVCVYIDKNIHARVIKRRKVLDSCFRFFFLMGTLAYLKQSGDAVLSGSRLAAQGSANPQSQTEAQQTAVWLRHRLKEDREEHAEEEINVVKQEEAEKNSGGGGESSMMRKDENKVFVLCFMIPCLAKHSRAVLIHVLAKFSLSSSYLFPLPPCLRRREKCNQVKRRLKRKQSC